MDNLTAILLAAGKGTRMQSVDTNKVAMEVYGEPMLLRSINILRNAGISNFVVVVGFAKDSVISILPENIRIAEQNDQLGTGHAVMSALPVIPEFSKDVLIVYGDDSFLHAPQTYKNLYDLHRKTDSAITFITMDSEDPTGYGRILRNANNEIVGIVEEKNASQEQKEIKEINLGCYIVNKNYLEKNIQNIQKNAVTGEYYITDIIDIVVKDSGRISAYKLREGKWRGVNTRDDLLEAEHLMQYDN